MSGLQSRFKVKQLGLRNSSTPVCFSTITVCFFSFFALITHGCDAGRNANAR